MPSQKIQFQLGMSISEFLRHFGTEARCAEALQQARLPKGFRCPRCDDARLFLVSRGASKLFQCIGCRHQASVTAGTMTGHSKLPSTIWFLAIHLISLAKTRVSARALKRDLGVSHPTAWLLHQNINRAKADREAAHLLDGAVQLHDAYLGGERSGGKAGRGSENKVPFVAALSLDENGGPTNLKLDVVSGFTFQAIGKWAKARLKPGCVVLSDGLGCFAAVTDAGCVHIPRGGGFPQAEGSARVQADEHRCGQPEDHVVRRVPRAEVRKVRPDLSGCLFLPVQSSLRCARPVGHPHLRSGAVQAGARKSSQAGAC
jgi:hypothetical protein